MMKKELAEQLHNYMQFRAKREGQGYALSPEWFASCLAKGATRFFGIEVSDTRLVEDEQQPELFAEWHGIGASRQ
jgi:hypothetical protein